MERSPELWSGCGGWRGLQATKHSPRVLDIWEGEGRKKDDRAREGNLEQGVERGKGYRGQELSASRFCMHFVQGLMRLFVRGASWEFLMEGIRIYE